MKKNISINLQGIIFHIEDDGYEVLSRYLAEVKAHFASYQGHEEIVADIEGRIAELFAARVSASKQVITLADVEEMTAKMGRVSDFSAAADEDDEPAAQQAQAGRQSAGFGQGYAGGATAPAGGFGSVEPDGQPRRLYRDMAHRKVAGVAAGLAQYFLINPLWVRLIFLLLVLLPNSFVVLNHGGPVRGNLGLGGLAFIAYVVLWIALPKRYDAPEPIDTLAGSGPLAGRKFYRDTTDGKVGGVAAGLAAYFNVDVTIIRILFLLGIFLGGSTLIIYLILWAVVPEARTVSERMQMRGDAVTLSGIDENLRAGVADPTPGARPLGTFFENAARGAQPAVSLLGTVLRWAVGLLLIFWGGSWLIGVLTMLGAALSIIPFTAVEHTSNGFMFDDSFGAMVRNFSPWGAVSLGLATGIPALGLILLGLRLIMRRPLLGRSAGGVLLGLWLLGVVGSVAAGMQVAREFQSRGTYTTTVRFDPTPAGQGIVLDSRNMEHYEWVNHLNVVPADSGAAPFVDEEFQAKGRTEDAARLTAQQTMRYRVEQRDSVITFDQGYTLKDSAPYRNQRLTLTLHLPLDRVYRLTPLFAEHLRDEDFEGNRRPRTDRPFRARITREGQFACLDCTPSELRDEDDDDDNDAVVNLDVNGERTQVRVNTDGDDDEADVNIGPARRFNTEPAHYGAGRKTLTGADDFAEIEVQGPYRLLVRQGDSYQVEAAGRESDLANLRLEVSGDRLLVRNRRDRGGLFESFRNHQPVLVRVTLPTLRRLEISAACEADVSGFRDSELALEANSAASVRLDVNVPRLEVQLSSASHADLAGTADELAVDGSSASELNARRLIARQVKLDLSSGSEATVHATEELEADLSSGSSARYAGHPARIQKDLSSGGSLEAIND